MSIATILILIPLVLQLTIGTGIDGTGFNWTIEDFLVIGFLLYSTALLCEFVLRKVTGTYLRLLICGAILVVFLLIWIDLAVGIFNIPGFSGN